VIPHQTKGADKVGGKTAASAPLKTAPGRIEGRLRRAPAEARAAHLSIRRGSSFDAHGMSSFLMLSQYGSYFFGLGGRSV